MQKFQNSSRAKNIDLLNAHFYSLTCLPSVVYIPAVGHVTLTTRETYVYKKIQENCHTNKISRRQHEMLQANVCDCAFNSVI